MPDGPIGKHRRLLQPVSSGYPVVVAITQTTVQTSPDRVFAVLADGWWYSDWVVGTTHIRDVDADWPSVGSQLHHKAGPWPLSLHDSSTVLAVEQDRRLKLRAGLWPLGEAVVDILLEPLDGGRTRITMKEDFERGPLLAVRNKINDLLLHRRNVEALRRLADLAERAHTRHGSPR
jgi:Polyketide cyclase / dehydrase and lipid transport